MTKDVLTTVAACPECSKKISLQGRLFMGRPVVCPNCESELEVINTAPAELDWIYEDEDEEEENEEEEEEDNDDW